MSDKLTIHIDDFDNKIAAIYDRFDTDNQFQRRFVDDPTAILAEHFHSKELNAKEVELGNRLMLSCLNNEKFVQWSRKFERRFTRRVRRKRQNMSGTEQQILQAVFDDIGREQFMEELAEGIVEFGDPEIMGLILDRGPAQTPVNGPSSPVVFFLVIAVAFLLAIAVPVLAAPGMNRQDMQRISRGIVQGLRQQGGGRGGPTDFVLNL